MSVTVKDILELPSLRRAGVIAGSGGLGRMISGVTVLEYAQPDLKFDRFARDNTPFMNNEAVITSFAAISGDSDAQCDILRRFSELGETCLLLYYVGIVVESVSDKLIATADELNFPLILMPVGETAHRYSDAITEIHELLFRDRKGDANIVSGLLEHMSTQPQHLQTVETALRLLSNRMQVSLALTDEMLEPLGEASWPNSAPGLLSLLDNAPAFLEPGIPHVFAPIPGSYLWMRTVSTRVASLRLYILDEKRRLNSDTTEKMSEAIRLSIEIWSSKHGLPLGSELVRAVINDEPVKMRRLAHLLHVDIESINSTWFLRPSDKKQKFPGSVIGETKELLSELSDQIFLDFFHPDASEFDSVIVFMPQVRSVARVNDYAEVLIDRISELCGFDVTLTVIDYCETTADVRAATHMWMENYAAMRRLFPERKLFRRSDFEFAADCMNAVNLGEAYVHRVTTILDAFTHLPNRNELLRTLEIYLLDCGMKKQQTADKMCFHLNTIKYRLAQVEDILGCDLDDMSVSYILAKAVAVRRLLR